MADEQGVTETWLHSVLNDPDDEVLVATVPGGFWKGSIPQIGADGQGVELPAGRFTLISGIDLMVANVTRVWNNQLWAILVTAPAGADSGLSDAVSRIDEVLHGQRSIAVGGDGAFILDCVRQQVLSVDVVEQGGVEYRQRGGQYRIKVKDAA